MPVAFTTKGADTEERAMPDCFGFRDDKDPSCKRCKAKEECLKRQTETRPICFGTMYSGESEECARCIDASQCIDMEDKDVGKKFKIRRLVPTSPLAGAIAKPDVEEVEDAPVDAPVVGPSKGDNAQYAEWSIPELREELETRKLDSTGSKGKMVRRLLANDAGEAVVVVNTAEVDEFVAEQRAGGAKSDEPMDDKLDLSSILMALKEGQAVVVTRLVGAQWRFEMAPGCCASPMATPKISKSGGLKGSAYWDTVLSDEFKTFHNVDAGSGKGWDAMTEEERVAFADKLGAKVEPHPAPKVFAMHLSEAVLDRLGIEKYKPEYQSRAARNAIKA